MLYKCSGTEATQFIVHIPYTYFEKCKTSSISTNWNATRTENEQIAYFQLGHNQASKV